MDRYDTQLIIAIMTICGFLLIGTLFFHYKENWTYVDSFYFTGATLTTVGYGDITPTHDSTKIASVFFSLAGIGIVFYSVSVIARKYFEREEQRLKRLILRVKK